MRLKQMKHVEYICNISLKHMKHVEHTLKTYVCKHCNIYNIKSFCNIKMKHTNETRETYGCKRLIDAELNVDASLMLRSEAKVAGAKPISSTGLGNGRSRRMGAQPQHRGAQREAQHGTCEARAGVRARREVQGQAGRSRLEGRTPRVKLNRKKIF
jgi:hypothetical protein